MATRLEQASDVATILAGISAAVIAVVLMLRDPIASGDTPSGNRLVENWEVLAVGHRSGSPSAPVTIVEFGDYECPVCRIWNPVIKDIRQKYPDDVALVYRHWPLPYHSRAYPAARAAECSAEQGRFWEYHDSLYAADNLDEEALQRIAGAVAMPDMERFTACVLMEHPVPIIEADAAAAVALNSAGTPTILVNGTLLGSLPTPVSLQALVDSLTSMSSGGRQ